MAGYWSVLGITELVFKDSLVAFVPAWVRWIIHFPVIHIELVHTNTHVNRNISGLILVIDIEGHRAWLSGAIETFVILIAIVIITDLATAQVQA